MKLEEKVALITGSGSGFGRAGAVLFAQEGAKLVVTDINDEGGQETVRLIRDAGGEATYVHVDAGVVADLERMVRVTVETYGKLDIFWHNAGIPGPGHIERTSEEDFDRALAVHLKGGFFGAKYAIPELRKQGGAILFTSSVAGVRASFLSLSYSMAKAGLIILTKGLARQLAEDNIRVNCICPGPARTPGWPAFLSRDPDLASPEEIEKKAIQAIPMGRLALPEDIARAALFLVSEEASFITGESLDVDGGYLAT